MMLPKKIGSSCAEENKMKIMYILLLLPLLYQCQSKKNIFESKEIVIDDIGKIGFSYAEIELISEKFGIDKKNLTSCIYSKLNVGTNCYPINDKTFDYKDYEKKVKNKINDNLKAKIYFKTKQVGNKTIVMVYKMEMK